jgi:hypothetical protein
VRYSSARKDSDMFPDCDALVFLSAGLIFCIVFVEVASTTWWAVRAPSLSGA